jgi:hypothetical protein
MTQTNVKLYKVEILAWKGKHNCCPRITIPECLSHVSQKIGLSVATHEAKGQFPYQSEPAPTSTPTKVDGNWIENTFSLYSDPIGTWSGTF